MESQSTLCSTFCTKLNYLNLSYYWSQVFVMWNQPNRKSFASNLMIMLHVRALCQCVFYLVMTFLVLCCSDVFIDGGKHPCFSWKIC